MTSALYCMTGVSNPKSGVSEGMNIKVTGLYRMAKCMYDVAGDDGDPYNLTTGNVAGDGAGGGLRTSEMSTFR